MRNHRSCRLLFWTLLALLPGLARADVYVAIDGIPGDSIEPSHVKWISANVMTWTVERGVAPPPVAVIMNDGLWSAKLAEHAARGTVLPRITIDQTVVRGGTLQVVFSRLTLREASIRQFASSSQHSGGSTSQVQIAYTSAEWEYWNYSSAGVLTGSSKGTFTVK